MGKYASEMVKVMQSWIGKKESNGSHKSIIDTYNNHKPLARGYKVKYTDSWCATTVSAAAITLGYTDIIPTECSCGQMITLLKNKGVWVENDVYTPKAGDIIMYDWDETGNGETTGWPEHVGLVEKVSNGTITVIEGNLNNSVARRTIKVGAKGIRGYGTPKYDAEIVNTTPAETPNTSKNYFARYGGSSGSIATALKAIGEKSDYAYRKTIAEANDIKNYSGTSEQNLKMLSLLKQGYLIKPSADVSYFKKYTGTSTSIVNALKAIGAESSYSYRTKIAKANNISLYVGTSKQNTNMLSLLKQGKLIKP